MFTLIKCSFHTGLKITAVCSKAVIDVDVGIIKMADYIREGCLLSVASLE